MRKILLACIMFLQGYYHAAIPGNLRNDHEAYSYCLKNKKSFIAIVWPIAEGKDEQIRHILNKYGTIKYEKSFFFTAETAFSILSTAHSHISNMHEHVRWYFPPGTYQKPARIFVLKISNEATAIACKMAVRKMFPLQYRSIHINDIHAETVELAQFFFQEA